MRSALLGCVPLSLAKICFQWFMVDAALPAAMPDTPAERNSFVAVVRAFRPTLRQLLVSDILIRFCERIPYAFILGATNHVGVSAQQYGWLVAIEMATAMLCYIPVPHLADKHGQRPFVLATFVFFTLFPFTLIFAHSFASLVIAFIVRGLKGLGEPVWALPSW